MDIRKRPEERAEKYGDVLDPVVTEYKTNYLCYMNVLRTVSHIGTIFTCNNYSHAIDAVAHINSCQAVLLLTEWLWEKIHYHSAGYVQTQHREILMCVCEDIPLQFLQKLWFIRNHRPNMSLDI